ncbi:unnamed protein product [Darwinula stevensoni]|uniref:Neurotransmitter-gated ion-channel ligand-binding domain-containing protein n=1 Tax=Darwinula stevensoni TaxID=69355 RepID=A0A7R9A014_9CRUS|nr:unnamed protein product [Darwinula stevensoni]CAG0884633.1 unnamed protein product [Darwinula stevensoni]
MTRFFLVACAVSFIGKAVGITHESTKKLKDTLLQDYDSLVPPIPSDGKPVSVRLGVVVISFRRDDLKGEAIWHLWLRSVSSDTFTSFTKAHLPSGFGIRWNLSVFPPVEAMLTWLKSHPGEHPPGSRRTCANDQVDFHWVGHPPGFKSTSYPPGLSARWMQKWNDERLMWEPSDHSNISTLRMPSDKVWIPDITPYNELKILEMTTRDVLDLVVDTSSRNSLKTKILFARFISDIRESSGPDKLGLDGSRPDAPDERILAHGKKIQALFFALNFFFVAFFAEESAFTMKP